MSKTAAPEQTPADLVTVYKTLKPEIKVQVVTRKYTRTVVVRVVRPAPHDSTLWYAYVSSGKVRAGSLEGGLIKYNEADGYMEFQPTLGQNVDRVLGLTVVTEDVSAK